MEKEIIYKEESYKIIGAAIEVHKELGCGFTETVYQEAFEKELESMGIPYIRERNIYVLYKNYKLEKAFRPDFECFGKIIVELKAVSELDHDAFVQTYNYLKATKYKLALLINFGKRSLEYKRLVYKNEWDERNEPKELS